MNLLLTLGRELTEFELDFVATGPNLEVGPTLFEEVGGKWFGIEDNTQQRMVWAMDESESISCLH